MSVVADPTDILFVLDRGQDFLPKVPKIPKLDAKDGAKSQKFPVPEVRSPKENFPWWLSSLWGSNSIQSTLTYLEKKEEEYHHRKVDPEVDVLHADLLEQGLGLAEVAVDLAGRTEHGGAVLAVNGDDEALQAVAEVARVHGEPDDGWDELAAGT